MRQYLRIVEEVLSAGKRKENRTGIDTLACPFITFRHDMSEGFPLLTTKKMGIKNVATELEGFLRGITSKKWYQDRGCHIWDEWANPQKVQDVVCGQYDFEPSFIKEVQKNEDDLGPVYGRQWRKYDGHYGELPYSGDWINEANGVYDGADQLKTILETLRQNPNDRRMICSAWNPNQMDQMALPACTVLWDVVVIGSKINIGWFQRSCDVMLGLPYDIASHAIILMLLAKYSGFEPGILHGTLADCHIYENHILGAKEQLLRGPRTLPQCNITTEPFDLGKQDIVIWTRDDIKLTNYNPHPKIEFEVAI